MKKLVALSIVICLCVGLSACKTGNRTHVSDYDEGYYAGYEAGLCDGVLEAKEDLAREARSQYQDMEGQTSKERGLHPEEAIMVLNAFLNGEYVSDDELETAIRSITYFYYHAWDVINDIEYMEVYFD